MIDLFKNISPSNKRKILKILEANTLTFNPNCRVLSSVKWEGMIGYVVKGYLQIIRIDYNGNRTIIEELEENSVFGSNLSSLKNNEFEIITKEESQIIIIDYQNIISSSNNIYPYYCQFIMNLLEITVDKIGEKNNRIEILTKKSIRDKLLEYFKIISMNNHSKTIYLTLNYSELADYLAVDRCALSRELKNLKDDGFIKKEGRKIVLLY